MTSLRAVWGRSNAARRSSSRKKSSSRTTSRVDPIRFHDGARGERVDAKRRYARRDPRVAARFDDALREVFARIREAPSQFAEHAILAVPTDTGPLFFGVRRALLSKPFPYVVFFYVRQRTAVVLAIAHARRRPGYWSERR